MTKATDRCVVSRRRLFAPALLTTALLTTSLLGVSMSEADAAGELKLDPENTVYLDTKNGRVVIQLRPELAPKTVEQFKTLVRQGFYDGTPFHRVIEGFMAQGGDPTGTGTGSSKLPNVPAEFSKFAHFLTGTVGMARSQDPNSGNSQFFICFHPAPSLDAKYTIFGRVVEGMKYVNEIKRGSGSMGMVQDPDKLIRAQIAADVK
jgi:peptidylprolyl isomerase